MAFLLNQEQITITQEMASQTVLNYLRDTQELTGTKEGCASGDCGACTVVVGELVNGQLRYKAINSCVTLMPSLVGKQLLTVEHLQQGQALHPVQRALVDHHGSQCGFCTPGFVMSLFTLYHQDNKPAQMSRADIEEALSGNLCRCTGYRPIIDAALDVCASDKSDVFFDQMDQTIERLTALQTESSNTLTEHLPRSNQALAKLKQQFPEATLYAGSTDLALEMTQRHHRFAHLINLSQVEELNTIEVTDSGIWIGAAVSLNDAIDAFLPHFPALNELMIRFASMPIRNQGTLGGNIANASPIGDFAPVMLALNGQVKLTNGEHTRSVAIRHFFTGYKQTVLAKNEWIEALFMPFVKSSSHLAAYKISKRFEDDISAVCAVFKLALDDNDHVESFATGFGGVAPTPSIAQALETQLVGCDWRKKDTLLLAQSLLSSAFTPIDDVRASAHYRQKVLAGLVHRFWLETTQSHIETRVVSHA